MDGSVKPTRPRTVPNQSTVLRRIDGLQMRAGGVEHADPGVAVGLHIGGLDVGLEAEDEPGVELIIVAELSAADDAVQILPGAPGGAERRSGSQNAGAKR